ncbi:AaceriAFR202Wp [[Ashbya] aceris (nom. inval.)]|nr:AaceriAFR202Wp [[Ashbya] aceris (nom. inval.)]
MFGPFKSSQPLLGGLLWKIPWRMSAPQKQRQRRRLQAVDDVVKQLNLGLQIRKKLESWPNLSFEALKQSRVKKCMDVKRLRQLNDPAVFPAEHQMSPKDKYTVFNKYSRGYRKGAHKVPKWTKLSNRRNPASF